MGGGWGVTCSHKDGTQQHQHMAAAKNKHCLKTRVRQKKKKKEAERILCSVALTNACDAPPLFTSSISLSSHHHSGCGDLTPHSTPLCAVLHPFAPAICSWFYWERTNLCNFGMETRCRHKSEFSPLGKHFWRNIIFGETLFDNNTCEICFSTYLQLSSKQGSHSYWRFKTTIKPSISMR